MIVELKVPYDDKDRAKALGAKWNSTKKTWFVADCEDLSAFKEWLNTWRKPVPQSERADMRAIQASQQLTDQYYIGMGIKK